MKLDWKRLGYGEDAILGDFDGGDGVRFSLVHMPTCHRRGPWRLLVEVATGPGHELWGCFDEADAPQRWYHQREAALSEAQIIADVLWEGRQAYGGTFWTAGKAGTKQDEVDVVWAACNAAYKKGLIDAAQDICEVCKTAAPRHRAQSRRWWHEEFFPCNASRLHDKIEQAGGWVAEWPKVAEVPHAG